MKNRSFNFNPQFRFSGRVREELSKAPAEALTYFQVQRWDGKLPVCLLGQTLPFLQLPQAPSE
jgi:hypothetical protein